MTWYPRKTMLNRCYSFIYWVSSLVFVLEFIQINQLLPSVERHIEEESDKKKKCGHALKCKIIFDPSASFCFHRWKRPSWMMRTTAHQRQPSYWHPMLSMPSTESTTKTCTSQGTLPMTDCCLRGVRTHTNQISHVGFMVMLWSKVWLANWNVLNKCPLLKLIMISSGDISAYP